FEFELVADEVFLGVDGLSDEGGGVGGVDDVDLTGAFPDVGGGGHQGGQGGDGIGGGVRLEELGAEGRGHQRQEEFRLAGGPAGGHLREEGVDLVGDRAVWGGLRRSLRFGGCGAEDGGDGGVG